VIEAVPVWKVSTEQIDGDWLFGGLLVAFIKILSDCWLPICALWGRDEYTKLFATGESLGAVGEWCGEENTKEFRIKGELNGRVHHWQV
jgi:hypothetical protein